MNVIDVTIVGGPDLAAALTRREGPGGTTLGVSIVNDGPVPARAQRVAVVLESEPVRRLLAPGWDHDDPGTDGPPAGRGPVVVTDRGTAGWLGAAAHRGEVVVQRDGWLLTAWAHLGGLIVAPGERFELDGFWLGSEGGEEGYRRYASVWAAGQPPLRALPPTVAALLPPGAGAADAEAAAACCRRHAPEGAATVLLASRLADVGRLAGACDALGAGAGVWCEPFGDPSDPADLTRPESPEALRRAGSRLASAGASWVSVTGAAAAAADRPRWGDAALTPVAALRRALAGLREGLGPGPVLHAAGGPPAALAGAVDALDAGAGRPDPRTDDALGRRAPLAGRLWHASPGPVQVSPGAGAGVALDPGVSSVAVLRSAAWRPGP